MFERIFMESKEKYDAVDFINLPWRDKIWNGAATNFGVLVSFQVFGYYLLYFYTDIVMISPATAGAIILFARSFDVVTDLILGHFIDKLNLRWGKYRSWPLIGILPQLIMFILVFTYVPGTSRMFTLIWCWITYGCYGAFCATLAYIPQNAQIINMTTDVKGRAQVAGLKGLFDNIGILAAAVVFLPLANYFAGDEGNLARGFMIATIIFSLAGVGTQIMNIRYTRKYELNYDGTYRPHLLKLATKESLPVFQEIKMFLTNRAALIVTGGAIILYIVQTVRNSMVIYLFEYYYKMPNMIAVTNFASIGLSMVGALLVTRVIRIVKDSNRAFVIMALMHAVLYTGFYLWVKSASLEYIQSSLHFGPMFMLYAICGLFQGVYYVFPMVMMPSAVDYGIYKNDRNQSGFIYAIYGAMLTMGGALGAFVSSQLLRITNYVPGAEQSEATLSGLLFVGVMLPAILSVVHAVMQMFSGITDKKHDMWIKDIKARTLQKEE